MTGGFPSEYLTLQAQKARSTTGQWWPAGTTQHISDPTLSPCLRKPTRYQALQVTHSHKMYYVGQLNIEQQGCSNHVDQAARALFQNLISYQNQAMQSIL